MFHVETAADGVSVFRMDDGKVNAMGQRFVSGFLDPWQEAVDEGAPVVLTGNGRVFSAGLNLKVLPTLDRAGLVEFFESFTQVVSAVLEAPVPVVAAVDGPAVAGGAVLALATDVRVVHDGTSMSLKEVSVGVDFPPPALEVCRHALPPHEHGPALLQAIERTGGELVDRGWAHHHVGVGASGADSVVSRAGELAGHMGDHDSPTYASVKHALNAPVLEAHERFTGEALEAYVDRVTKRGLDRLLGIV